VVGCHFTGHELAHGLLEKQVLFVEEVSPHQSPPSRVVVQSRILFC
jgi:hypothetical protein